MDNNYIDEHKHYASKYKEAALIYDDIVFNYNKWKESGNPTRFANMNNKIIALMKLEIDNPFIEYYKQFEEALRLMEEEDENGNPKNEPKPVSVNRHSLFESALAKIRNRDNK